jgi:hypothetical protein
LLLQFINSKNSVGTGYDKKTPSGSDLDACNWRNVFIEISEGTNWCISVEIRWVYRVKRNSFTSCV